MCDNEVFLNAAKNGDVDILQKCLDNNIDVNTTNKNGYTALHLACSNTRYECVKLLLNYKANINMSSKGGCVSPLHEAAEAGDINIVKILLENGADISCKSNHDDTVLHFLLKDDPNVHHRNIKDLIEIVEILHEKGAKLDAKNSKGQTALHKACVYKEFCPIVEKLVELGADRNICDNNGDTAYMLAKTKLYDFKMCDVLTKQVENIAISEKPSSVTAKDDEVLKLSQQETNKEHGDSVCYPTSSTQESVQKQPINSTPESATTSTASPEQEVKDNKPHTINYNVHIGKVEPGAQVTIGDGNKVYQTPSIKHDK